MNNLSHLEEKAFDLAGIYCDLDIDAHASSDLHVVKRSCVQHSPGSCKKGILHTYMCVREKRETACVHAFHSLSLSDCLSVSHALSLSSHFPCLSLSVWLSLSHLFSVSFMMECMRLLYSLTNTDSLSFFSLVLSLSCTGWFSLSHTLSVWMSIFMLWSLPLHCSFFFTHLQSHTCHLQCRISKSTNAFIAYMPEPSQHVVQTLKEEYMIQTCCLHWVQNKSNILIIIQGTVPNGSQSGNRSTEEKNYCCNAGSHAVYSPHQQQWILSSKHVACKQVQKIYCISVIQDFSFSLNQCFCCIWATDPCRAENGTAHHSNKSCMGVLLAASDHPHGVTDLRCGKLQPA